MGVRNNRASRDDDDDDDFAQVLDKPLSLAIGFSHRKNRGITGTSAEDIDVLSFVFCYGPDALKGVFIYRVLIHSGERF